MVRLFNYYSSGERALDVSRIQQAVSGIIVSLKSLNLADTHPYRICGECYNSSNTMAAKPIKTLDLRYPMSQFLIIKNKCVRRLPLAVCFATGSVETAGTPSRASSESETESSEEEVKETKEKSKKTSKLTVPTKTGTKQRAVKSPRTKRKKVAKGKKKDKQEEEEEEEVKEEEDVEEKDKIKTKTPLKKEEKGLGLKRKGRDLVVGECREEKAPYVKVREARMVTLADKVSICHGIGILRDSEQLFKTGEMCSDLKLLN